MRKFLCAKYARKVMRNICTLKLSLNVCRKCEQKSYTKTAQDFSAKFAQNLCMCVCCDKLITPWFLCLDNFIQFDYMYLYFV